METTEETTLGLLSQLCDRQQDLSPQAHVAVMEAFNRFVDLVPTPPVFSSPVLERDASELLVRTRLSLARLLNDEPSLARCLVYGEVQQLLALAAAES